MLFSELTYLLLNKDTEKNVLTNINILLYLNIIFLFYSCSGLFFCSFHCISPLFCTDYMTEEFLNMDIFFKYLQELCRYLLKLLKLSVIVTNNYVSLYAFICVKIFCW